jgi:MerR family transcriptional regulator/heat shock protein HspR
VPALPIDEPSRPIYTVGQVAEMLDVQQAFLRRLDAQALVSPARSDGAQRRYSRDDIDRVQDICALIDEGLTLAGVRRVLELQAEVSTLKREIAALKRRR